MKSGKLSAKLDTQQVHSKSTVRLEPTLSLPSILPTTSTKAGLIPLAPLTPEDPLNDAVNPLGGTGNPPGVVALLDIPLVPEEEGPRHSRIF